jgi:hypothetical protein
MPTSRTAALALSLAALAAIGWLLASAPGVARDATFEQAGAGLRDEYLSEPPSELDPDSFESLERERYRRVSIERADALEMQRRRRALNPDENLPLFYPATVEWSA